MAKNHLNVVVVGGNLTADPETEIFASGKSVTKFSVASNRSFGKEEVSFFNCKAWGDKGDVIAKYIKKGMPIIVRGSIIQERWETDGEKRSTVIINVEDFTFVSSGNPQSENSEEEKPGGKVAPKASAPPKGKAPAKKAKPPVDDDDDDDDEGF